VRRSDGRGGNESDGNMSMFSTMFDEQQDKINVLQARVEQLERIEKCLTERIATRDREVDELGSQVDALSRQCDDLGRSIITHAELQREAEALRAALRTELLPLLEHAWDDSYFGYENSDRILADKGIRGIGAALGKLRTLLGISIVSRHEPEPSDPRGVSGGQPDTPETCWFVERRVHGDFRGWWTVPPEGMEGIGGWETTDPLQARRYTEAEARSVAQVLSHTGWPFHHTDVDAWIATEHMFVSTAKGPDTPETETK
ncbi:MAG TPA: hypothetical protein VHQ95_06270, partial [Pyrinomonadaceae bacterium]|nr:hypothetical protein [Pyrinomonadaceae bacterium]